jgi:hypothetical protein
MSPDPLIHRVYRSTFPACCAAFCSPPGEQAAFGPSREGPAPPPRRSTRRKSHRTPLVRRHSRRYSCSNAPSLPEGSPAGSRTGGRSAGPLAACPRSRSSQAAGVPARGTRRRLRTATRSTSPFAAEGYRVDASSG